jgi:DNA polymerase III epsilon subunit family exonuclease
MSGIRDLKLLETPISVIDFETTGLSVAVDRVVEVSVARIDANLNTCNIVFDSLVNPQRKMDATHIHGITNNDVADAPTFREIVPDFLNAVSGTVVTSYNIGFDIKFLKSELKRAGISIGVPHFCIMYLRNIIKGGICHKLQDACQEYDILIENAHCSRDDTIAAAELLLKYLAIIKRKRKGMLFSELASLRDYKFWDSFDFDLVPSPSDLGLEISNKTKSRNLSE